MWLTPPRANRTSHSGACRGGGEHDRGIWGRARRAVIGPGGVQQMAEATRTHRHDHLARSRSPLACLLSRSGEGPVTKPATDSTRPSRRQGAPCHSASRASDVSRRRRCPADLGTSRRRRWNLARCSGDDQRRPGSGRWAAHRGHSEVGRTVGCRHRLRACAGSGREADPVVAYELAWSAWGGRGEVSYDITIEAKGRYLRPTD